jgi:hypothetical protein
VDSGEEIHRIQVKTTTTEDTDKDRYSFVLKHGGNNETYASGTVDFFALVVLSLPTIYLVPFDVVDEVTKCSVYPGNPDSAARLEIYRENWDFL